MKIINLDEQKRHKAFQYLCQGDVFYWIGKLAIKLEKDDRNEYTAVYLSDGRTLSIATIDMVEIPYKAEVHITREED